MANHILVAEFTIEGSPKLYNAIGRKSWHIKAAEAKLWRNKVSNKCHLLKINGLKLDKATLSFTRHSMKECDFDGLVQSMKHVQDGLVAAGVIIDDKPSVIGQPSYKWEFRARRLGGMVTIKIERPE